MDSHWTERPGLDGALLPLVTGICIGLAVGCALGLLLGIAVARGLG